MLINACKATLHRHADAERLPPIRVVVTAEDHGATIKVADEGGGFLGLGGEQG